MILASAVLLCVVVAVADGDTLRADCGNGPVRIRLADIDAPERDGRCVAERRLAIQATGAVATRTMGRAVAVRALYPDRYGRTVARVEIDGTDLGESLIRDGFAKRWPHDRGRALAPRPDWCGPQ